MYICSNNLDHYPATPLNSSIVYVFIAIFMPHISIWLKLEAVLQCREPSSYLCGSSVGGRATAAEEGCSAGGWIQPNIASFCVWWWGARGRAPSVCQGALLGIKKLLTGY